MQRLLDRERLVEAVARRQRAAMASHEGAGPLQCGQISADGDCGGGELPGERHDGDPPALVQEVANPTPALFDQQSRFHRALGCERLAARLITGIGVVHG